MNASRDRIDGNQGDGGDNDQEIIFHFLKMEQILEFSD
jgi:hypothetical protein